jgi:hypothetical protein
MNVRSALRRLAVTLPFFLVATAIMRVIALPLDVSERTPRPLVLIVTTEHLHPPFRALEQWNGTQGCRTRLVTLADHPGTNVVSQLGALCREEGATGLLLGGDEQLIPLLAPFDRAGPAPGYAGGTPRVFPVPAGEAAIPSGVRVSRAPVRDLGEAWAFVEACRTSGRTLDRLLAEPVARGTEPPGHELAGLLVSLPPSR